MPDSLSHNRLSIRSWLILIVICVASLVPGIYSLPVTDRDEALFVQASRQMVESGDLTDIKVQDKPRYKKPIGIYWLQYLSIKTFAPNTDVVQLWAWRLPSLLGAILAVLMTAQLGVRLFNERTGFWAGVALATCVLLGVEARLAKTDAAMLGCITVAQYVLLRALLASQGRDAPISKAEALAFWAAQAAAFLIKGPIALLVSAGTLIGAGKAMRGNGWWQALRPSWGVPLLLIMVVPWFAIIMFKTQGAFAEHSAGKDMLAKLWQGQNRGIMPPGLYLLALPVTFFPASIVLLRGLPTIWKERCAVPVRLLLAWTVTLWMIFELALTKLPHYVLVLYPPLAILAAAVITKTLQSTISHHKRWLAICAIGAVVVASLAPIAANMPQLWPSRAVVAQARMLKPCEELRLIAWGYSEPSLIVEAGTRAVFMAASLDEAIAKLRADACALAIIRADKIDQLSKVAPEFVVQTTVSGFNSGIGKVVKLAVMGRKS